ncbi:MAG: Holliday junction resolvase RuvX [Candidatus Andersenbacteria bacterium]|nr:Holliday junction resolvase RuvX [Candidatus Andersenbacteria bacterium]MCK4592167.1 Holliday junction resolvase RuvX [Candidatus Parcubacteria bacterium]
MAKILAIDYGDKRIGLAISDENEKLASCFLTLENKSPENLIEKIKKIILEKNIQKIILGIPIGFKGGSVQTKNIREFSAKLNENVDIPIIEINEIFTSKMAKENLRKAGVKSENIKEFIDQEAARIILQDYLDNKDI